MHPDKIANFNDAFKYLAVLDSNFQLILDLYGTPNIPSRPEGFETLCKIILEQQVSLDSAKATLPSLPPCAAGFVGQTGSTKILSATVQCARTCTPAESGTTSPVNLDRKIQISRCSPFKLVMGGPLQ